MEPRRVIWIGCFSIKGPTMTEGLKGRDKSTGRKVRYGIAHFGLGILVILVGEYGCIELSIIGFSHLPILSSHFIFKHTGLSF